MKTRMVSYHLSQFKDHGTQTVDVSVVPWVHHAQVGTKSAGISTRFRGVFLKTGTWKRKQKHHELPDQQQLENKISLSFFFLHGT